MKNIILILLAVFIFACSSPKKKVEGTDCCPKPEAAQKSETIYPDWSTDATIYEVNIRQYTPEGTFSAFEKHLPRLQELGVEILWLMPFIQFRRKNAKARWDHTMPWPITKG